MASNNYSYSKIDTYVQCPFKYKLKYIDGNYCYHDTVNTEVGTLIHSCEESIAKAIQSNTKIDYADLKNKIIFKLFELKHKYPKDFCELDKSKRPFIDKLYYYLETGIYKLELFMQLHPTYKIVGIEQPFELTYKSGEVFKGFIDRVFYDSLTNKYIIQDIKTYAVEVEKEKLATPLQFVIYMLAVEKLYNCAEAQISCQYYLPFCDCTQDAGTNGFINRGILKIDNIFQKIKTADFTPNPNPLCNWCEYCKTNPDAQGKEKYLCPYFSHWDRNTRNKADINNVENSWQGLEKHQLVLENYLNKINKTEVMN